MTVLPAHKNSDVLKCRLFSSNFSKFGDFFPFYVPVGKALASDEVVLHLGHSKLQALPVTGKTVCRGTKLQEFDTF